MPSGETMVYFIALPSIQNLVRPNGMLYPHMAPSKCLIPEMSLDVPMGVRCEL